MATSAARTLPPSLLSIFAHHPNAHCKTHGLFCCWDPPVDYHIAHCPFSLPIAHGHFCWDPPSPYSPFLSLIAHCYCPLPITHCHCPLPFAHCHCPLPEATFAAGTLPPCPLHLQITHHPLTPHILSGFGMLKSLGL